MCSKFQIQLMSHDADIIHVLIKEELAKKGRERMAVKEETTLTPKNASQEEERPKGIQLRAETSLAFPGQIDSEVNLLKYPFFALSRGEIKGRIETVYEEEEISPEGKSQKYWQVTSNAKYGYPGPFDRKVFRAIESIISELPKPIENPIHFSLYDLCKRIGIGNSGENKQGIKEAIERIVATTVKAKGTFYSKDEGKIVADKSFHLYESVVFYGQEMPDGKKAESNYLYLNPFYLKSINAFYVKPLDYLYLRSLKSPIAERLYELLGVKFFGKPENQPVRYLYSTICELLPIRRQPYLSLARKNLNDAFKELTRTNFFAKEPEWQETDRKDDWYIFFYEGERARQENLKNARQPELPFTGTRTLPQSGNEPGQGRVVGQAREMVLYFYQTLHQTDKIDHEPSRSELALAEKYLKTAGEDGLKKIIEETIRHARQTNWQIRSFGSIKVQAPKTLAEKRTTDTRRKESQLKHEYNQFIETAMEKFIDRMPRAEFDKIVDEEKAKILKTTGKKTFDNSPIHEGMLESNLVTRIKEMAKLPEYEDWIPKK